MNSQLLKKQIEIICDFVNIGLTVAEQHSALSQIIGGFASILTFRCSCVNNSWLLFSATVKRFGRIKIANEICQKHILCMGILAMKFSLNESKKLATNVPTHFTT